MEENESPQLRAAKIQAAVRNIQTLIATKKYQKAYELLKIQLKNTPEQPEFVQLYSQFKQQYTHDKIQKLQQQADMHLRSGQEDKAQEIFREIYRLDPSRTELKDSFRKTRGEIVKDYNKLVIKTEVISLCTQILIVFMLVGLCVVGWKWWNSKKHLKQSEEYIVSLNLDLARQELAKCSRFFCPQKDQVSQKLRLTVDGLIAKAYREIESNNFELAQEYLALAQRGTRDQVYIEQAQAYCQHQRQQWQAELARQEAQKLLSEKALAAGTEFENNLAEAIQNDTYKDAADIIAAAQVKNQTARTLFANNEFEAAYKQWLEAVEDCKKASIVSAEIRQKRKATLKFKIMCDDVIEKGININAPVEANEIWLQATAFFNDAETQFSQNNFEAAVQLWQQAADKYSQAVEFAKQSAAYAKALMFANKWKILKAGLAEENIRNFFGEPTYIQADSERRVWYYGYVPTIFETPENTYQWSMPQSGYVVFAAAGIQTLIEKSNDVYRKQVDDENQVHSKIIADLNSQIDDENRRYQNRITITPQSQQTRGAYPRIQPRYDNNYYNETQKHDETIMILNNSIKKENHRHQTKLIQLKEDCDARNYALINGLTPRELKYSLTEWKMPDVENLKCFMQPKADIEKPACKPQYKWQIPARWRAMKLNIGEGDVIEMLGEPDNKYKQGGVLIYQYGELGEYGLVRMERCIDSVIRVRSWTEPLWVYVTLKLAETANPAAVKEMP